LVFQPDTAGDHYDKRFALRGWAIDSCVLNTGIKAYETAFGDENLDTPHSEYSAFRVRLVISRTAIGLFWKMFLGKYIIDSALPESASFTLVDTLHGITLFFIFTVIAATTYSLVLFKNNKVAKAKKFDMYAAQVLLLAYIILNVIFITNARIG
jgi:hypothetical protein